MDIELVAIGDEVLNGFSENGNGAFLANTLIREGFTITRHTVVGDALEVLKPALQEACTRAPYVITTGGLGPTLDDNTRKAIAELFGVPLEMRKECLHILEKRYGTSPTLVDQATLPLKAHYFENKVGTAFGCVMEKIVPFPQMTLIALPGVPTEMRAMCEESLLPFLKKHEQLHAPETRSYHFVGLKEPAVDSVLRTLSAQFPSITYGIYPSFAAVSVRLTAPEEMLAKKELHDAEKVLLDHFGKSRYFCTTGAIDEAIHNMMIEKKLTLALAESCTGGALAHAFVKHPDASRYFKGSVVAYANDVKEKVLHVKEETLRTHGAVSEEVTVEMAEQVQKLLGTDCAIAVSGILGPTGGSPEKPVGTICATLCVPQKNPISWTGHYKGTRKSLLERVVQEVLAQFYEVVHDI